MGGGVAFKARWDREHTILVHCLRVCRPVVMLSSVDALRGKTPNYVRGWGLPRFPLGGEVQVGVNRPGVPRTGVLASWCRGRELGYVSSRRLERRARPPGCAGCNPYIPLLARCACLCEMHARGGGGGCWLGAPEPPSGGGMHG